MTRPTLKAHTTVTENLSAQNKKNLVIWRYDHGSSPRPSLGKKLGGHSGSDFVRGLRRGECVVLWARARYEDGGVGTPCCNMVDSMKMHIFWAV